MKNKEAEYLMQDFVVKAQADNDPYLVVHFSREQNYFLGLHEGLSKIEAQIIIKQLMQFFDFDEVDCEVLKQGLT